MVWRKVWKYGSMGVWEYGSWRLTKVNYLYKAPVTQCDWEWGARQSRFVSEAKKLINHQI